PGFWNAHPKSRGIQNPGNGFLFVAFSESRARRPFDADQLRRGRTLPGTGLAAIRQARRVDLCRPGRAARGEGQANFSAHDIVSESYSAVQRWVRPLQRTDERN